MSKFRCVLKKLFFLIFSTSLFLGCCNTKLLINVPSSSYFNYDKIRISLVVNDAKYAFKGFIYVIKDTSLCFRLWGPLGYELGRGQINDIFFYFDALNDTKYIDLKQRMEGLSGLVLNKYVILNLLSGSIPNLSSELLKLNKEIVSVVDSNNQYLELLHNVSHQRIFFKYKFQSGYPSLIFIKSKGADNIFELTLEIVEISHVKKNCRFKE